MVPDKPLKVEKFYFTWCDILASEPDAMLKPFAERSKRQTFSKGPGNIPMYALK